MGELGWCEENVDTLLNYINANDSKAFIVLERRSRIVIEWYADDFEQGDNWYWASAGKTVSAYLTGIAEQNGHLSVVGSIVRSPRTSDGPHSIPNKKKRSQSGINWPCRPDSMMVSPIRTAPILNAWSTSQNPELGGRTTMPPTPYWERSLKGPPIPQETYTTMSTLEEDDRNERCIHHAPDINETLWSTPRSMARFGILALERLCLGRYPIVERRVCQLTWSTHRKR